MEVMLQLGWLWAKELRLAYDSVAGHGSLLTE